MASPGKQFVICLVFGWSMCLACIEGALEEAFTEAGFVKAFQHQPTPSSIIQNFAEGNLWLDNNIPEAEKPSHFIAPESQDIFELHDTRKYDGSKHFSQDSIAHWDSQSYWREEPYFSLSELGTGSLSSKHHSVPLTLEHVSYVPTEVPIARPQNLGLEFSTATSPQAIISSSSQSKDHHTLYQNLDEWCDIPGPVGEPLRPHLIAPGITRPLTDMEHTFQGNHDVQYKFPFLNRDPYVMMLKETTQDHGITCNNIHNRQRSQVSGSEGFNQFDIDQSIPYLSPRNFQASSYTVGNPNEGPSDTVNSFHFPDYWIKDNQKGMDNFGMIPSTVGQGLMNSESRREKRKASEGPGDSCFLDTKWPWDSPHMAYSNVPSSSGATVLSRGMEDSGVNRSDEIATPTQHTSHMAQSFPTIEKYKDIAIKDHPFQSPLNGLISSPVIQRQSNRKGPSEFSTREAVPLLLDIGVFFVNNSPSLCYETTLWFEELKHDMIAKANGNASIRKHVEQATGIAHSKITTCFLGLILIFATEGGDPVSWLNLLQEGWNFIKLQFGSWIDADLKIESNHPGVKRNYYFKTKWNEPASWYKSLSSFSNKNNIPADIINSLVVKWDQNRTFSRIGINHLGGSYSVIQKFHESHVKYSYGGLYSRSGITNLAFIGLRYCGDYQVHHERTVASRWHEICLSLSHSAQFHSPKGIEMCQEVHAFFGSLVEDLLSSYKQVYNLDISLAGKRPKKRSEDLLNHDPHKINIETIIRVNSMGEYRLTVIFIGLVKVLYQKETQDNTLRILLKSAWDFLKGMFSKWKDFNFQTDLPKIFDMEVEKSSRVTIDWSDPYKLFNSLSQNQVIRRYPIPIHGLKSLYEAWSDTLSTSKFTQMNDVDFKVI
ncbi:uncharacterized protein MELLADRAFT_109048 [Melampsora larici-populina 98AG31]|uniref:Secreted protein n=1 Tax=Melampsora larici-populina (strain 98AG31 / pathotype 3-4-7) TaxID=747676 RepID=F4RV60_MELLP|nr:uncharacterized protein MELLADRAFT_109048 [Melampsora larici-populina 98AG31]EGG03563.1 hypothetical protein MELLADRAFT_109048 [Melampsora larici-populina 98AG31]